MTLRVFLLLIENLPVERIRKIPPDTLPLQVPVRALSYISSPQKRAAVESILFNSLNRDIKDALADLEVENEAQVLQAIDEARSWRMSVDVRLFNEALTQLIAVRKHFLELLKKPFPDEKDQEALRKARLQVNIQQEKLNQLLERMYQLRRQREHFNDILLTNIRKDQQHRFQDAIEQLNEQSLKIDKIIAPFLTMRLVDAERAISEQRDLIRRLENEMVDIQQQIEQVKTELALINRKNKSIQNLKNYQQKKSLLANLYEQKAAKEIIVLEKDLTRWLDYFVEANVNQYASVNLATLSGKVKRGLYYMLSKFCETQEDGARKLAAGGISNIDADKAIQFLLQSERVILDYFASKKKEYSQGISETAKMRMRQVELLENDLLLDLKESQVIQQEIEAHDRRMGLIQESVSQHQALLKKKIPWWQKIFGVKAKPVEEEEN
jgi:hypothetical protein